MNNKRQLTFLTIGILLFIIVAAYSMVVIQFLVGTLNRAFSGTTVEQAAVVRFQIGKAEEVLKK
ncbi:MAG: hypothetical protein HZB99_01170 [Candidatus Harrisonbacteria bacterium]|nr:hypothetical protein [Candidatus Harrisonbacteria bacterium]